MITPAVVIDTFKNACQGNLAAHIQWDKWRLAEREQVAREFPSARTRRAAAYMRRKVASMEADLQRRQERQAA